MNEWKEICKEADHAALHGYMKIPYRVFDKLRAVVNAANDVDAIYDVCDGQPGNGPSHGRLGPWKHLHDTLKDLGVRE